MKTLRLAAVLLLFTVVNYVESQDAYERKEKKFAKDDEEKAKKKPKKTKKKKTTKKKMTEEDKKTDAAMKKMKESMGNAKSEMSEEAIAETFTEENIKKHMPKPEDMPVDHTGLAVLLSLDKDGDQKVSEAEWNEAEFGPGQLGGIDNRGKKAQMFMQLDDNHDGYITSDETTSFFKKLGMMRQQHQEQMKKTMPKMHGDYDIEL